MCVYVWVGKACLLIAITVVSMEVRPHRVEGWLCLKSCEMEVQSEMRFPEFLKVRKCSLRRNGKPPRRRGKEGLENWCLELTAKVGGE